MVNKETRVRLIEKLENIIELGGEEVVDFLDKMLDMVWCGQNSFCSTLRMTAKKN